MENTEEKKESIEPNKQMLDQMRTTGYRPTVVACAVCNNKVLLLFKQDFRLWGLPQGGVQTGEETRACVLKEIEEELGKQFAKSCSKDVVFIGEDSVEFLPEKQTGEELSTEDGKLFKMVGKHYYFYAVPASTEDIDLKDTEYNEYYWLNSKGGLTLASKIYQPGKRRITMKAIELLKKKGLIS